MDKQKHLKRLHPFLRNEFRTIKKAEIKKKSVFVELFGEDAKVELWKLKAIYEFQN